MKHIRSFNELNKSTYLSAAKKLNKLGGVHKDRSTALKKHARERQPEYDVHNLYYHEFNIFYKQLGIHKNYYYKDMMLGKSDLYTIVDTKIIDDRGALYGKALLIDLCSAKTGDDISIELGFHKYKEEKKEEVPIERDDEVVDDLEEVPDYGEDDFDDGFTGETDGEYDDEDDYGHPVFHAEEPVAKKGFIDKISTFWKKKNEEMEQEEEYDYDNYVNDGVKVKGDIFLYIRHIAKPDDDDDDGGSNGGNTFNHFKFRDRQDALELKRFIADWYKKDDSEFMVDIKSIPVNKLYA